MLRSPGSRAPARTATSSISVASARRPRTRRLRRASRAMTEPLAPPTAAQPQSDAEAREGSIDPRRSILLQAPAGSGKTTVLTQRFLRLLAPVREPDAVLAITFTRKAAAEMRGRISRALRGELAASDPSAARLRALATAALRHGASCGWDLLNNLGALRIQTIDSLNYWLASQLPVSVRAGGGFSINEHPGTPFQR